MRTGKAIVLSTVLVAVSIPALAAADLAARDLTPLKDLVVSKGETVAVADGKAALPIVWGFFTKELAKWAKRELPGWKIAILPSRSFST